jgi:hypothetical protein
MQNTTTTNTNPGKNSNSAGKRPSRWLLALYVPGLLSLLVAWGEVFGHRIDNSMLIWDKLRGIGFAAIALTCFILVFRKSSGWSLGLDISFMILAAGAGILCAVEAMRILI